MSDQVPNRKRLIEDGVAHALTGANFSKKKLNWHRQKNDLIQIINLQKSYYSDRYYLNFGIFVSSVEPVQSKGIPKEYECHVRWRVSDAELSGTVRIADFFDLSNSMIDDQTRIIGISQVVKNTALATLNASDTYDDLRALHHSGQLKSAFVQRVLTESFDLKH